MQPRVIFDGDHLRATALGDDPERLIITFDHWARLKTGFPPDRETSSWVEKGFTNLHIVTRRNDWFVNPDLPQALIAIADAAAGYRHKVTLSFSMGGFGALMVSRLVDFQQVLMVSPHSTFSKVFPPYDTRFASDAETSEFGNIANDLILNSRKSAAECVVLFDSATPFDTEHAQTVRQLFRKPRLVELRGGGHPATRLLTDNKRFGLLMKTITGPKIDERPLVRQHARLLAGGASGLA